MKTLNIPLEDSEFKRLEMKKGKATWREFILETMFDDPYEKLKGGKEK